MNEKKYALLVGSSEYPESNGTLPPLPSAVNDIDAMTEVLSSPHHGGFSDVFPLMNLPHHIVQRRINEAIRTAKRDDLILIYYSGHGALDRHGNLYFTTINTEPDLLYATSIPAESLRLLIQESRCRRIIVILDCCYSGAIGASDIAEQFQRQFSDGHGSVMEGYAIFFMLGANAVTPAYTRDGDQNGLMTKHIVQALATGAADANADGVITMSELYDYVKERVANEAKQEPRAIATGTTGTLIVARTDREQQQEALMERVRDSIRQAAVEEAIPKFVLHAVEKILEKSEDQIRKDHESAFGLLRDFANQEIGATEFVNQWYLFEKTGLPKTALEDRIVEADERWEIVRECRRPLLDIISPSYLLDKHYHFLDWNPMFDELIAKPMGLIRGSHAEDFILKLKNRREVIERSRTKFEGQRMPLVDIEPLEFESPTYGLIRFQKIAAQIAGDDGRNIAWSVNLNITDAGNEAQLWTDMQGLLDSNTNWSKYAKSYDKMLLEFDAYNTLIKQVTSMVSGAVIADLASGTGNGTIELLRQNRKGSVLAFEANEDMLEFMRKKLSQYHRTLNCDRVKIYKGDLLTSLREFPSRSIDGAMMINSLYAIQDKDRCLREVYRVLKPGGCFAFSTSTKDTDVERLFAAIRSNLKKKNKFDQLKVQVNNAYERNMQMQEIIHDDSLEDVVRYATTAGFTVKDEDIVASAYEGAVAIVRAVKAKSVDAVQPSTSSRTRAVSNKTRVFISYAHEDEQWCQRFMQYIDPMVESDKFEVWTDKKIDLGDAWLDEIQENMEQTTHAILLISTAFLTSEFIRDKELPELLIRYKADGLRILPVLLETCLYDRKRYRFPDPTQGPDEFYLKDLQMASVEEPLAAKSKAQQNETLYKIAEFLKGTDMEK